MKLLHHWIVDRAGSLVLDHRGSLWMLQEAGAGKPARVVRFSPEGKIQQQTIEFPAGVVPVAMGSGSQRNNALRGR